MRQVSISRFLILALAISTLFSCKKEDGASAPIASVSSDALLIADVRSWSKLEAQISKTQLWQEADSLALWKDFLSGLKDMHQYYLSGEARLLEIPFLLSVHRSGAKDYAWMISVSEENWTEGGTPMYLDKRTVAKREYEGHDIWELRREDKGWKLFAALCNGVLVISPSDLLIEKAIRQISTGKSLRDDSSFEKLMSTANKKDVANLYLRIPELDEVFKRYFHKGNSDWPNYSGEWISLDLNFKSDQLVATGLTSFYDSIPGVLNLFSKNSAQRIDLAERFPSNTAAFVAVSFENFRTWERDYKKMLWHQNKQVNYQKAEANEKLKDAFTSWVDNQFALCITETKSPDLSKQVVAVFKAREGKTASEKLFAIADPLKTEVYRGLTIGYLPYNVMSVLLGELFHDIQKPYFAVEGDYVWFANDISTLRAVINDYMSGRVLSKTPRYEEMSAQLDSRAHILLYAENPEMWSLAEALLTGPTWKDMRKHEKTAQLAKAVIMQWLVKPEVAQCSMVLSYSREVVQDTRLLWSAALEAPIAAGPWFITNHLTQMKEVIVQDENKLLYHFDSQGKLLYSRALDGIILSEMHQIDKYKNQKLQMLFHTANGLYLMDRNGKDVDAFPIELKPAATAPMAVLDYDRTRTYRLVIPCGKMLLNLDADGQSVSGWQFKPGNGQMTLQPQLFQVGGKDYLVVREDGGKVRILNRSGQDRLEVKSSPDFTRNAFYFIAGQNLASTRIVSTTEDGQLASIFLSDGLVDVMEFENLSPGHSFLYVDEHYVVLSEKTLYVKGPQFNYSGKLNSDQLSGLKVYQFSTGFRLGLVDTENQTLHLFDGGGKEPNGFPLTGSTTFSIGDMDRNGILNLLSGSSAGEVVVYSLE